VNQETLLLLLIVDSRKQRNKVLTLAHAQTIHYTQVTRLLGCSVAYSIYSILL